MLFDSASVFPNRMAPFIKEVGRGKRGARNLTREQSREAMAVILDGEASEAQIGAYFQAMRIKGETPEELAGMIEAVRACCNALEPNGRAGRIEIGLPYDGRLRAFHVLPFAAQLVARTGLEIFLHGEAGVGPKFGVNAIEVLEALGIEPAPSVIEATRAIRDGGLGFCTQQCYSPALARLRRLRDEVILRGPLATVEKMLNLSGAAALIAGNFHTPYAETMADAFGLLVGKWGGAEAWVVQSTEGHVDLDPNRSTSARRVGAEGDAAPWSFDVIRDSTRAGEKIVPPPSPPATEPRSAAQRRRWIEANVQWGRSVLEGGETAGRWAVLATTALLLLAGKRESDYPAALKMAGTLLER